MKKLIFTLFATLSLVATAQVGINTSSPASGTALHIDGAGNTSGTTNISDDVVVTTAGKVGVGTTAPDIKFHVVTSGAETVFKIGPEGTNNSAIRMGGGGGSTYTWIDMFNPSGVNYGNIATFSGGLIINTVGTNTVINSGSGSVGIGTSTPSSSYKLDVNGGIRGGGNIQAGASLGTLGLAGSGSRLLYVDDAGWVRAGGSTSVTSSGWIGIGTTDPQAPLHVATTTSTTVWNRQVSFSAANNTSLSYYNGGATNPVTAIAANGAIVTTSKFLAAESASFSDERIKNIEGQSNRSEDLNTLMKLKITDYTMKDVVNFDPNKKYKKVIAQEVEAVYPQAISKSKGYITDVYGLAKNVVKNADNTYTITLDKVYDLDNSAKNIRLDIENIGEINVPIISKPSATEIIVSTDKNLVANRVFVYGEEVDDYRAVDYDALSMLNISATQQQQKEIESLKAANSEKDAEISELKSQLEAQQKEIEAIKAMLNK